MKKKIVVLIILFIIIGSVLLLLYKNYENRGRTIKSGQVLLEKKRQAWLKLRDALENKIRHFKGKVSLVITDLDSNWEIAFNKDTLIPSASLVKIPIMLSCFYTAQEGKVSLKDTIRLKSSEKIAGSRVLGKEPPVSVYRRRTI